MRIIITVDGGLVSAVYTDGDKHEVDIDVLDYDNMSQCDVETENGIKEYTYYTDLETQLENNDLFVQVW